ncbi:MAG: aldehyde ferredoxin oxidoreductase family protein [Planctomycetes bacterium]|nr:aldehyde ferredoxin oxidoreductase family protein [Planctomycetota bacterium]
MPRPTPGYHGRYLRVDLTTGRSASIPLPDSVLRRFIGGSGLGAYLLLRERAAAVDPLSPDAPLAFVFSPLVGSPLTTSAKFAVVSKSPLTGRINDSLASSQFALAGKRTGHDAIVLVGRCAEPMVLVIDDGNVWFEPAGDLWGMDCRAAEQALRARLSPAHAIATIGPAGERLVRYATISHDGRHAGRGGSGAVLGSKNLKALAVAGTQRCGWAEPEKLIVLSKVISQKSFGAATAKYRELGTASNLLVFNRLGVLPTRNFQQGSFAGAATLSPEQLQATRTKTRQSCAACTIGCEHIYSLGEGDQSGSKGVRLEYENLFALGPLCGIDDPDTVLRASRRCDELGLDTISAGGTIAFAMECVERGLLDAPWLRFGDGDALLTAIEQIGRREGLGDLLAAGSRRAAEAIGGNSISFAPQVKGLEIPGYEPRALQTMALGFAVGTRGADHNRSTAYEADFSEKVDRRNAGPEAVDLAIAAEDRAALIDSLILCKFLRGVFEDLFESAAEMLRLTTGWDVTAEELHATARRIVTAKKLFNIQAGWQPEEDRLPDRFLDTALATDPSAILPKERLRDLIRRYNLQRGWTAEGWVSSEQLKLVDDADN